MHHVDTDRLAFRLSISELRGPADVGAVARQLEEPLRWRNARGGRQLSVALVLRNRAAASAVAPLVQWIDDRTVPHLDRPGLFVYCAFPDCLLPIVQTLADADQRVPRVEMLRIVERPLEAETMRRLLEEAKAAEAASLMFRPYLHLARPHDIARLGDLAVFRQFPVVEVKGRLLMIDADPIARYWSAHPRLQDSAVRSLGGRVETFFRLYEHACLADLGIPLATVRDDSGLLEMVPPFVQWATQRGLIRSEPRVRSSVLEHDVDILADSHECQSPVFLHASVHRRRRVTPSDGSAQ